MLNIMYYFYMIQLDLTLLLFNRDHCLVTDNTCLNSTLNSEYNVKISHD